MRRAVLIVLCICFGAGHSFAAEATREGAQALVDVFHRYVGPLRAGQPDHVRAEPVGDAYRVALDLDQLASRLAPAGFSLDAAEVSFLTKPLPDGTWSVSDLSLPTPLTVRMPVG